MNACNTKTSQKRKFPHLKRSTDPDGLPPNGRRRMTDVAQTLLAPKNGNKKAKTVARGAAPKRKLPKPPGSRTKDSESGKKKKAVRAKKPFWVKSVCGLQTLSVPIITRSMSKCFDSWKSGGRKGPRPDIWVAGPRRDRMATGPKGPVIPKKKSEGAARQSVAYRPVVSRSRKLQLRQKILNYMYGDLGPCRGETPTHGSIEGKEDISTQTLDDVSSTRPDKAGPSSAHGQQNVVLDVANLVRLEASVQVDIAPGEERSTLRKQNNAICDQYDLDPDLYRINHSPVQHDPVWINQYLPKTTHQCMVTERETLDAESAGERSLENSAISPTEIPQELISYGSQNSPETFKSTGFHYRPRNSASIHLGFSFSEPFRADGLSTNQNSVPIENNAILDFESRNRLVTPAAIPSPRPSECSVSLSLNPERLTSPSVPFTSQIFHPRVEKSKRVDRSKRSKLGLYSYRCLSPKEIKVLDVSHRKSKKQKPRAASPSCLCCAENMRHVCRCCLKIRSKLRTKTKRVSADALTRYEPKAVDVERVNERKNGLDASIEAAHHVYKKLKEIIRYYRCGNDDQ